MKLLENELNLQILRNLVSGAAVKVNIHAISNEYGTHRSTIKKRILWLYENNILTPPFYPFPYLFVEYPLFILVRADIPRSSETRNFFMDDSHIFAAFSCMEGPYNTLLLEFFEDLESYHSWREQIVLDEKLPDRQYRAPANSLIFSNKQTFKYNPGCFVEELTERFEKDGFVTFGKLRLDALSFRLLVDLMKGRFIHRNDTLLSRTLGVSRKTISKRVETLLDSEVISKPQCLFPHLFIPPGYNLVVSLIEVKSNKEKIKDFIKDNVHVPRAQETSTGVYNLLTFSAFDTIEGFFDFGEELTSKFSSDIGGIENSILSSKMIHTIKPQKLSLACIERKLWKIMRQK